MFKLLNKGMHPLFDPRVDDERSYKKKILKP